MKWRKVETLKGYIHVKNYKILNIMISLWGKVNKYIKKSLELTLLETQKNKKYQKIIKTLTQNILLPLQNIMRHLDMI